MAAGRQRVRQLLVVAANLLLYVRRSADALTRRSIDHGWRFRLGEAGQPDLCPGAAADPFEPLNATLCETWGHVNPHGGLTVDECRLACCADPACAGWLHSKKAGCYMGDSRDSCAASPSAAGAVGGIRSIPATVSLPTVDGPQSVGYDDSAWRTLSVPHDYVVEQAPNRSLEGNHGYRRREVAWYRRNITALESSDAEAVVWLEMDGVYRSSDFWFNGKYLGHHSSGYTSFRFELTGLLKPNEPALLAIRVDPRANEGWFYEGGGIYRHAWLLTAAAAHAEVHAPVHIAPWGVHAPSVLTSPVTRSAGVGVGSSSATADATVTIITTMGGLTASTGSDFSLTTSIVGPGVGGPVVWAGSSDSNETVTQHAVLKNAVLWEPPVAAGRTAALYTVMSEVKTATHDVIDVCNTTIGIRSIVHSPDRGLLVNGRPVKAKGMCNHQDFAGVGTAVPDRVQAFRVRAMAKVGVNAWRMSHNPPNPELLDELDNAGMLVMNENRNL